MLENIRRLNQLNAFEIKAEILGVISKLGTVKDLDSYEVHFRTLDAQTDKKIIVKLLFKEFNNINDGNAEIIKYLLKRYGEKEELTEHLWVYVKNSMTAAGVKIAALDLLRELNSDWSYEDYDEYLNTAELVDEDTRRLLCRAIANPEVQIDFLDFISSLGQEDKITLLNSLSNDYTKDELANILIPVFLSQPDSETGKLALSLLGESKSRLAFHALSASKDFLGENPLIKKNLSILKMAGIREDNSTEFYRELMKDSKPYRFCITYPDGYGNQAVIFSRMKTGGKVQFAAAVINDSCGIRDCFGFNEISKFECNTIIDRFYRNEKVPEVSPEILKAILLRAEKISSGSLPYEYVCWRNILADIEPEEIQNRQREIPLNAALFEKILCSDFMEHWFLDADYSGEFKEFLAGLNADTDFDKAIDENLDKIFYTEEKQLWTQRLLTTAHLKGLEGEEETAQALYSLYKDKEYTDELLKNILRKSIYEYYTSLRHSGVNADDIIEKIEQKWVKDV
ncbi:MAG: hypothetical protein LBK53_01175 [Heliobacteriaceae bacterium]|jgi:hypothetical protein|nr:hypothetical protein [Heliobacteriaceae bacterium]